MGSDMVSRVVSMSLYERCSMFATFCKDHSKTTVECVLGTKVSNNEWHKINIHYHYPGSYEPVIKPKVYRQKINAVHLQRTFASTWISSKSSVWNEGSRGDGWEWIRIS